MMGINGAACLCALLLLPSCWGSLGQYVWQRGSLQKKNGGFTLTGWLLFLAGFELLAVTGAIRGWGLHRLVILTIFFVCVLFLATIAAFVTVKDYRSFLGEKVAQIWAPDGLKTMAVFVLAFVCIAAIYALQGFRPEVYQSVPERVTAILADGALYHTDPFTGRAGVPVAPADRFFHLPTMYAVIASAFGLRTEVLLFRIFPCVWLIVYLLTVFYTAAVFFEKKASRRVMLIAFVPVVLCGSEAYMNVPYGILHAPYEAASVMGAFLLPFLFALLMQGLETICERRSKGMTGKVILSVCVCFSASLMTAGVAKGLFPACMQVVLLVTGAVIVSIVRHFKWNRMNEK